MLMIPMKWKRPKENESQSIFLFFFDTNQISESKMKWLLEVINYTVLSLFPLKKEAMSQKPESCRLIARLNKNHHIIA